jgi:membrane-associated phospholipid phosphatase
MSNYEAPAGSGSTAPQPAIPAEPQEGAPARVGTVVWGLTVLVLAALIIISRLGLVALNGTYVLIGLMVGAGAALVIGGLLSARRRDKESPTRKS